MPQDRLSEMFSALADPTRRAILARLVQGEATVNELAEPFDITQPSVSRHLKVLEHAGFISRGRAAQTRPCRLETAPMQEVARWIEVYRHLWDDSMDRLDNYLTAVQAKPKKGKRNGRKTR
jgi:DNA-binding transcriptional ArsR family regulator